jgi:hypothetical protein
MSVELSVERELAGKTELLGEKHNKSHMTSFWIEPGPPWWEAGD